MYVDKYKHPFQRARRWGMVSNHYCIHFRWREFFSCRKSWWFIPKKPIIVSHGTSLKELPVEFLLCLSHIRWWPCEKLEQRKPSDIVLFFLVWFFYFYVWSGPYKDRRIAWWFCLHKHQLQWGERKRYMASIWLLRRLTYLRRAYG